MSRRAQAEVLGALHRAPEILTLVNVWDVESARIVAEQSGTRALATASHAIAASLGYPDGEVISRDEMLGVLRRIVAVTELPVTADLEAGYGDPAETVRRAVGVGVVGANLEDQLSPLPAAVRTVEAAVAAGAAEGVELVLNARTDAFLLAPDRMRSASMDDAITRGRAFLAAGAACVFVPGVTDPAEVVTLVEALGRQRVSLLAGPGSISASEMEALGVARVSVGPWSQRIAMAALAGLAAELAAGGRVPR